ncbi:hypothetical protein PBY51_001354 [Eleginops maclovinus]|uniref:Uncharacterized protein n=1 Tax=Eleginops maclovinus TaxID=56733 RepID=A0AAN7WZL5_ELEMC|nr:hypothetical protein PBY51_001354 [Eleginops maclovinus]
MHLRRRIIPAGSRRSPDVGPPDPSGLHGASDGPSSSPFESAASRAHCCRAGVRGQRSQLSCSDVLIKRALHLSLILTPSTGHQERV